MLRALRALGAAGARVVLGMTGVLALAVVVGAPCSCGPDVDAQGVVLSFDTHAPAVPGDAAGKDRYLAMRAKKSAVGGFACVQVGRELWAPFRWEVTAGVYDSEHDNVSPGSFGTELDVRGSDPLQFFAFRVKPVTQPRAGLHVQVESHLSPNHGDLDLAGATGVDLAIEHDGTNLVFTVRETGTSPWLLLGAIPLDQRAALLPSLEVSNLGHGAEVGFECARVVANGPSPLTLLPEQQAARDLWDHAVDDALEALYAMDGNAPDLAAVTEDLAAALDGLHDCAADVQALEPTKSAKKAAAALQLAQAKLAKASQQLKQNKPQLKILKSIGAALDASCEAAAWLDPLGP
jgi:hypothetical protein